MGERVGADHLARGHLRMLALLIPAALVLLLATPGQAPGAEGDLTPWSGTISVLRSIDSVRPDGSGTYRASTTYRLTQDPALLVAQGDSDFGSSWGQEFAWDFKETNVNRTNCLDGGVAISSSIAELSGGPTHGNAGSDSGAGTVNIEVLKDPYAATSPHRMYGDGTTGEVTWFYTSVDCEGHTSSDTVKSYTSFVYFLVNPPGPGSASTLAGSETQVVSEGVIAEKYDIEWSLTRLPDCDGDGIPDGADPDPCEPVARIIVEKQTVPDASPELFTFSGDVPGQLADGQSTSRDVEPGSYTLVEDGKAGWEVESISCSNGAGSQFASSITIDVEIAETVRCVFTNRLTSDLVDLRVLVDGPGRVDGPLGIDDCEDDCSVSLVSGTEVTLTAKPDEPNDGFVGWHGCPVLPDGLTCTFTIDEDTVVEAEFDPLVTYAPWIRFHPDEARWPDDPNTFLANSELRWANIRSHTVRPCRLNDPHVPSDAGFGDVDPERLGAGGYEYTYCWQKLDQFPRRHWKPQERETFSTKEHAAPRSVLQTEIEHPAGKSGFYLNLNGGTNACRHWGVIPGRSGRCGRHPVTSGEYTNAPKMYVEYAEGDYIIYWLFYSQNEAAAGDVHEADWEHITVFLDDQNRATQVAYWQHLCDGEAHRFDELALQSDDAGGRPSHPPVWVANGSHASYHEDVGFETFACANPANGGSDSTGSGLTWRTWQNGIGGFALAEEYGWYGYGGGWGSLGGGNFWGPLGPGPLKLEEALEVE